MVACAAILIAAPSFATCFDGVRNGPESDVDCGGDCPACERGDYCRTPRDCYSGRCAEFVCAEREYTKGAKVPAGYRIEASDADSAAITRTIGWTALALGYGTAYVAALSLPGQVSWLYAPVVGPWIEVSDKHQGLRGLLAVDGFFQTVGAALVIGGVAAGGRQLVRDEGVLARVRVSPVALGRSGFGIGLGGRF